jgi:hypothetical protein
VKQKGGAVKKYSIKEVDSLIESIKGVEPGLTEEAIAVALNRTPGYISQLRSREKATGQPQVSPKFVENLKLHIATLQNSTPKGIEANLMAIARSLTNLENGQHYIRAEVRGYGQYQIQQEVKWDQEKFLQAMAKVGMIVGANLQAGDLRDNGSEMGS